MGEVHSNPSFFSSRLNKLFSTCTHFCIPSLFLSSPRQNLQPYCFVTTLSCPTQTDCKHALHIDHCRRRARRRRRCPRPELPRIQQRCQQGRQVRQVQGRFQGRV